MLQALSQHQLKLFRVAFIQTRVIGTLSLNPHYNEKHDLWEKQIHALREIPHQIDITNAAFRQSVISILVEGRRLALGNEMQSDASTLPLSLLKLKTGKNPQNSVLQKRDDKINSIVQEYLHINEIDHLDNQIIQHLFGKHTNNAPWNTVYNVNEYKSELHCMKTTANPTNVVQNVKDGDHITKLGRSDEIKTPGDKKQEKPSSDQLMEMKDYLVEKLPRVLFERHDYSIYTADVSLENNYVKTPYTIHGVSSYIVSVAKWRAFMHLKYAQVFLKVVSAHCQEVGGTITVKWTIGGLPQLEAFKFWNYLPWLYKKNLKKRRTEENGISTFYLNADGKIYYHRVDSMEIDPGVSKEHKDSLVEKIIKTKNAVGSTA